MPACRNLKHEKFCQEYVNGRSAKDAAVLAGYDKSDRFNSSVANILKNRPLVVKRIEELLAEKTKVEDTALKRAIERLSLSKERVLLELARIAFADLRQAVKWRTERITTNSGKEKIIEHLELVDSDDLGGDISAAISSIKKTSTGLSIAFHDKRAALVDLGKHLGLFKEEPNINNNTFNVQINEADVRERLSERILQLSAIKERFDGGEPELSESRGSEESLISTD